uniref:SAP domain-containing protein n=1 Tax=Syphacia muris TaxID=451379 RepID=A0A0N5ARW1_9BILA
ESTVIDGKVVDVAGIEVSGTCVEFESGKEDTIYPPVDLALFESVDSLMHLGLEHLKKELEVRGLKCGGTLKERAERLFSVRGLKPGEYPKALKSVPQKKRTSKQ